MVVTEYAQSELAALVPWPARDANKYTRGVLTVLAGCSRYPGAAALAAVSAQRAGAGYTEVVCAPEAVAQVRAASPSLVVRSWSDFAPRDFRAARHGKPCACVVGPGFDAADAECERWVHLALSEVRAPLLVDGGGLAAVATPCGRELARARSQRGLATVLTPHAGEAARLAGPCDAPTDDAPALAASLAEAYGAVVLLKGPESFISDGVRTVAMREGTPALAKAGTGDVLAGMVGALLAQGLDALDACVLGAALHARAGVAAARDLTDVCVVAEDLPRYVPQAIRELAG